MYALYFVKPVGCMEEKKKKKEKKQFTLSRCN